MTQLVGIYYLLYHINIVVLMGVLVFMADHTIHLMRDFFEGLGYQTALSAKIGDLGLVGSLAYGVCMLQREGVHIPEMLQSEQMQIELLMLCLVLGAIVSVTTTGMRSGQVGDIYHDVVLSPVILFLAIILVPVLLDNAQWYEMAAIACAVILWVVLIFLDIFKYKRFNQREYLFHKFRYGFKLKGRIPKG